MPHGLYSRLKIIARVKKVLPEFSIDLAVIS